VHVFGQPKKKTTRLDGIQVQTNIADSHVASPDAGSFAAIQSRIPAKTLIAD